MVEQLKMIFALFVRHGGLSIVFWSGALAFEFSTPSYIIRCSRVKLCAWHLVMFVRATCVHADLLKVSVVRIMWDFTIYHCVLKIIVVIFNNVNEPLISHFRKKFLTITFVVTFESNFSLFTQITYGNFLRIIWWFKYFKPITKPF